MFDIQIGDFVSHIYENKTMGVVYETYTLYGLQIFEVFWIKHPDIAEYGHHSSLNGKALKKFKPWPGFYKK